MRRHQGALAGKKRFVQDDVRALTYGQQIRRALLIEPADFIGENPGGIDDDPGAQFKFVARFHVPRQHPAHATVRFQQTGGFHVVDDHTVQVGDGSREGHRQPGIVELRIVIQHAPAQAGGFKRRNPREHFITGKMF